MGKADHLKPHFWKPGQSGNISGRPTLPPELRAIAALSQREVCRYISKYARFSAEELKAAAKDPKTTVLELAIASVFVKAIEGGDAAKLSFLIERAVGRAPISQEDDEDRAARDELKELSTEELVRILRERIPSLKEPGA